MVPGCVEKQSFDEIENCNAVMIVGFLLLSGRSLVRHGQPSDYPYPLT